MNYVKEAEQILYYYRDLNKSIANMDRRISRLVAKAGPKNLSAQAIDNVRVSGSSNHDETINLIFEIQKLVDERERTMKELEKAECVLKGLNDAPNCEHFEIVLRKWFIENTPMEEIAEELGYVERNAYKIRARAIRKFAVRMFGIETLKAI